MKRLAALLAAVLLCLLAGCSAGQASQSEAYSAPQVKDGWERHMVHRTLYELPEGWKRWTD